MAQLLIRKLEDEVKAKLQRRARLHGRSTEEEVRDILRSAVATEAAPVRGLGSQISSRYRGKGLQSPIRELRGFQARPAELER